MATEQFLTEKTPWRSFSTDKQYVSKKRPLNLHAFFPSTGQICDITLVKCVRQLLSLPLISKDKRQISSLGRGCCIQKILYNPSFLSKHFMTPPPHAPSNSSAALVVYIINAALVCLKMIRIRFCFLLLT